LRTLSSWCEADRVAWPELGAPREVRRVDDPHHGIAAGGRVVREEDQGTPVAGHLHRPGDETFARQLALQPSYQRFAAKPERNAAG
jgi:hypothetical protein